MRFINGGRPTPREVIENETLPRLLWYYDHFAAYGFWAAVEKSTGDFIGWFHFRPPEGSDPDEVEPAIRWTEDLWAALRPFSAGVYVNELGDEGPERTREAYHPATWARLRTLKDHYDPANVFHLNQNVAPA